MKLSTLQKLYDREIRKRSRHISFLRRSDKRIDNLWRQIKQWKSS